jgi:regulator of protease activity HflC (stomatin/prohibitin superfamily)
VSTSASCSSAWAGPPGSGAPGWSSSTPDRPDLAGRPAGAVPRDPEQTAITQDNASISIDFIIFYKVVDPAMSVLQVQNFAAAAQNVAATTLRSVVGDMPLDDVLSKREEMNASLRIRLDDVTERWGVKVTTVEVREVNPPKPGSSRP